MFSCTSLGSNTSLLLSTFLIYAFLIRSNSVLKNILLMTGSKVTHSRKSPFLNALTTSSLLPHFWPLLSFPKPVVITSSLLAVSSMSALNNSGHSSSTLAAFPGFVLFNASLTSCYRHLPRSISSISSNATISSSSTGFVGSSLLNISLKCSNHL